MSTVLRADGYQVVVYTRDHLPPHVHVFLGGGEEEVVVCLDPVAIREIRGMRLQHVVAAVRVVEDHAGLLMMKWREVHG